MRKGGKASCKLFAVLCRTNDEGLNVGAEHDVGGDKDEEVSKHLLSTRYSISYGRTWNSSV